MRIPDQPKEEPAGIALADLLTALTQEFAKASVSHHLTQEYWRNIYQRIPALAEHRPSSMQVVSCKLSLPVAMQEVQKRPVKLKPISVKQVEEALSEEIEGDKRSFMRSCCELAASLSEMNGYFQILKELS